MFQLYQALKATLLLLLLVPRFAFQPIAAIGEHFPIIDKVEWTLRAENSTPQ